MELQYSTHQSTERSEAELLRRALQANGVFSGASGLAFVLAAQPLSDFLGLNAPGVLMVVGGLLLLYAIDLWYIATRPEINRKLALAAIVLDVVWVVGSIAILLAGWPPLTVGGKWAVAIVADIVAVFAIVQFVGLRRVS